MGTKLTEKRQEFEAKQAKLHKVFEQAGPEVDLSKVTEIEGDEQAKLDWIKKANKELSDLGKEVEDLQAVEAAAKADADRENAVKNPQGIVLPGKQQEPPKTLGQLFVESKAFKEFSKAMREGPVASFDVTLKTLMQTSAGWAPESTRIGRLAEMAARPPQVLEFVPRGTTGQAAVVYMQETTRTHAAAATAEGGTYAESTFVLAEQTANVRKITDSLPVTDEQLDDVEGIRSYIDARLQFGLEQELDNQIINGSGVAPNLTGILNNGSIQSQSKGTLNVPDAFYKALRKIRVTGRASPNLIVTHPEDWEGVRLMKDDKGNYVWGHPAEPGPDRLWGIRVVAGDVIAKGTGLAGDFMFCMLFERSGIDMQVGYTGTQFVEGKRTIRADIREAFPIWRAPAFCEVTGL